MQNRFCPLLLNITKRKEEKINIIAISEIAASLSQVQWKKNQTKELESIFLFQKQFQIHIMLW